MQYIEDVEEKIGKDSGLILAKEIAIVQDNRTGEGYLIRDLSFMKDGNYYLPAFSLPYAGREIALYHGEDPHVFWKKHYAEVLGRMKARLLLRYGLQMETPNAQNFLIQLDHNFFPTGKIVFRDMSDTVLIIDIAKIFGEDQALLLDEKSGVKNSNLIFPNWKNSAWRLNQAGENSYGEETLKIWEQAHRDGYAGEIEKSLGVDLSRYISIDDSSYFRSFFLNPAVRIKIRAYRAKQIERHRRLSTRNIFAV